MGLTVKPSAGLAIAVAAILAGCRGSSGPFAQTALPNARAPMADGAAQAESVRFESIGPTHMSDGLPTSGKVNAFAIDPRNANAIYMASGRGTGLETYSSAGILRTQDGGHFWTRIDDGLTDSSGAMSSVVNDLWIDRAKPSVLLAATEYDGVFRSGDGGTTWTNVYRTTGATQVVSFEGAVYAATAAGILRSSDDGFTWHVDLRATADVQPRAFGAVEGTAIFAGMSDGSIWRIATGGWTKVGTLPFTKHTGTDGSQPDVHQIAVDPLAPATIYASANDGQWDQNLHASTDGGKTWKIVLAKVYYNDGLGTQAIAFSKVFPHRLYVGSDGWMYYIAGDGSPNPKVFSAALLSVIDVRDIWTLANGSDDACWVASDQGLDYEPTCSTYRGDHFNDTVVSAPAAIGLARRFTVSPDGRTVMASLQDFDSHYTTDGGATWRLQGDLYEDGFNELRPGNPHVCYAYDEAWGLSTSSDGCVEYTSLQKHIFPSRLMTTPIAFDPRNPLRMYVLSGPNVKLGFDGPKGVYESTDGGATIARLVWPFAWPGAIVVDQRYGPHVLVSDLAHGKSSISMTGDGGKTWTKASGVPATPFWYAMTISPVDGHVVLASSVDAKNDVFVLRSTDGGRHFARVATVVNAPLVRGRAELRHELRRDDRETPEQESEGASPAFVYSPARAIRYNQRVTSGVADAVVTTLRGAYLSSDNGTTWHRLDAKLVAHSFWEIRWLNGSLYLASDGQGVLRSTSPVQR